VRLSSDEVAAATGGRRVGPDVTVDGAAIDSRSIRPGQLFVPVIAERDGHEFVDAALDGGAVAYLWARAPLMGSRRTATAVVVPDTSTALLDLGRAARARLAATVAVVGITGSVGKTTVKDLTAAALGAARRVAASEKSFNNELGVPLTLLNAPDDVEAVVVEMGARGRGHIGLLCTVARPTIGVVTAVAKAHTEMFGTLDEVAASKGELVEALPGGGTAVLNADDPLVAAMASRTPARVVRFGRGTGADVRATDVEVDDELRTRFVAETPWGRAEVRLAVRGEHQVANALAAMTAALAAGVPIDQVVPALAAEPSSPWRMALVTAVSGARILNDAYNANPASMEAALRALARLPARRRVAILGAMAELGPSAEDEHRRAADLAGRLGIDVVAVGTSWYGVEPLPAGDDHAVLSAVGSIGDDDAVLVKGSRVAGLERVAERLVQG
jgi:UDP-N-acetylmuramoyl-tripeptide--D-alanyl-D-alanine ligase